MDEKTIARFWSRVDKRGPGECWPWRGPANRGGYGRINIAGIARRAHQASYELSVGEIPNGLLVCHTCDVRHCVNPAHLFLGTWADNARDMIAKGRKAPTTGVLHGQAKLTDAAVREMRTLSQSGLSDAAIGRRFGVSKSVAWKAINAFTWRHV